jgi:hypothetical protein
MDHTGAVRFFKRPRRYVVLLLNLTAFMMATSANRITVSRLPLFGKLLLQLVLEAYVLNPSAASCAKASRHLILIP